MGAPSAMDRKAFERQKARLRDAILHDLRLTRAEQRIGYEIADHLNFRTGDAWPTQEYLAARTGYDARTVRRASKRLAGEHGEPGSWFAREIDGSCYRYVPLFEQLTDTKGGQPTADKMSGVGCGKHRTLATRTPDIDNRKTGQNVRLSSLREPPYENPLCASGKAGASTALGQYRERAEQGSKGVAAFPDQDTEITAAAAGGGACRFVFEGSEPWRAWSEYRQRNGISGPLPTRQHMVNGRWRTGWDVPTIWPPGFGRMRPPSRGDSRRSR